MPRQIYVNLPVADLKRSVDFFSALGFRFDPKFTDDHSTCMIAGDNIFIMLVTHDKFKLFTPKPICDASQSTEVLVCLTMESKEEIQEMVERAVAHGAQSYTQPQDHPLMYGHGFQDPDGHIWELLYFAQGSQGEK